MILVARRFGFSIWLIELFRAVEQALGKREIIAEDLGYMSETVRQLVRDSGFPGMKVLEFAFDSRDTGSASDYLPHNYPVNSVAYTGTHDNETLVSWYQTVTDAERAMVRDYLYDYATPEEQLYKSMIALILRSAAATCIVPMQDWLGLDNSARINKPSTVGQNWRWRLKKTQLTKKLARLYGADLTVDARPMGCSHNLCVSITGIKDQFALEGEKLTQEYAALALGTAFHPYFVGSTFDPEAVGIEKQMLKKALEDEVNDKRLYCQRQANREFFGDSPAGVRQEGYLEEVEGLTPEQLTAAYYEMLRTANIELLVLGCTAEQTAAVKDALLAELAAIDRCRWRKTLPCPAGNRCTKPKPMIWCRRSSVCCSRWANPCAPNSWLLCALPWRCTAAV